MGHRWVRLGVTGLRRAVYALVALPVALCCLALAAAGRGGAAATARVGSLRRLAGARPAAAAGPRRLTKHLLLSLPADVVAFAVAGYLWLLLPMNLLYPVRLAVYDESARDSWGGPTLAGAWAVHAAGGVAVFVLVGLPIAAGLAWVQAWIADRTLAGSV
jgi:hypothetical protein